MTPDEQIKRLEDLLERATNIMHAPLAVLTGGAQVMHKRACDALMKDVDAYEEEREAE